MTIDELHSAIDEAMRPAEEHMAPAHTRGIYPYATDWATEEELAEAHRLQMLLSAHPENTAAAARARADARRAARRAVAKNDSP